MCVRAIVFSIVYVYARGPHLQCYVTLLLLGGQSRLLSRSGLTDGPADVTV